MPQNELSHPIYVTLNGKNYLLYTTSFKGCKLWFSPRWLKKYVAHL